MEKLTDNVDVTIVGGCVVDLISSAPKLPELGETIYGGHFMKNFGGNGANQSIMAQRLGASTALITKLGNESFGHEYIQNLEKNGVQTEYISMTNECSTSTAAITAVGSDQRSIIYIPGSNMKLTVDDVKKAEKAIRKSKVLVITYEMPLDSLLEALKIANDNGVMTVVNAAPPQPPEYEKLYVMTDILCLNEEEAEAATGIPMKDLPSAKKALNILLQKVKGIVVLTLGKNGVIFRKKDDETCTHIPSKRVEAVDCLGAGDAFLGSLIYFLSKYVNLSFHTMIQRACEIAAVSVTKHGTQPSYPYPKDLPESLFRDVE